MRPSQPPTLLCLLFTILSSKHLCQGRPSTRDQDLIESQYHYLSERTCAGTICGWEQVLCCTSGQVCSTNAQDQAVCVTSTSSEQQQENGENGQWEYYTTTYVETDLTTVTSTYSSFCAATSTTVATPAPLNCDASLNESPCGTICCAVGQYCAANGYCAASNAQAESSSAYVVPVATTATNTAFIRPTSNVATTITTTGSATTTVPFQTPTSAGSAAATAAAAAPSVSNNGLSGGAIAGIVIGVLAAIFLLFLLCTFCLLRGLFDGMMSFFGLGRRRRREDVTIIEERHSHHASGGDGGRRWWGAGPSRVDRVEKKKDSGVGGFLGVAGALAALAVLLGLKRRRDEKKKRESEYSDASSSYVSYESYTVSSPCEYPA